VPRVIEDCIGGLGGLFVAAGHRPEHSDHPLSVSRCDSGVPLRKHAANDEAFVYGQAAQFIFGWAGFYSWASSGECNSFRVEVWCAHQNKS
jgi:hypothetical protein